MSINQKTLHNKAQKVHKKQSQQFNQTRKRKEEAQLKRQKRKQSLELHRQCLQQDIEPVEPISQEVKEAGIMKKIFKMFKR